LLAKAFNNWFLIGLTVDLDQVFAGVIKHLKLLDRHVIVIADYPPNTVRKLNLLQVCGNDFLSKEQRRLDHVAKVELDPTDIAVV